MTTPTFKPARTISSVERAVRVEAQKHSERYIAFTMTANRWYAAGNYAVAAAWDRMAVAEKRAIPDGLHKELDRMYVSAHIKQLIAS